MLDYGFYNMDCMEGMKQFPDNYFDLAIVDPPYGDGGGSGNGKTRADSAECSTGIDHLHSSQRKREREKVARTGGTWASKFGKKIISWDVAPPKEYFNELFRVSRNQIIWGGNYFELPPTRCFLVWKKHIPENFSMAMCEYAWTSFNANAKVFEYPSIDNSGMRFHPTQKPIQLYEWILRKYAHEGDKILDTHVGSASSLIACRNMGHKYVGFEIDEYYYNLAKKRLESAEAQMNLWDFGFNPYQD